MRWLIWASFFPPHVGGYERNVFELAKRLVSEGHIVRVVTCNVNGASQEEVMEGVSVTRLPCWKLMNGLYPIPKPSHELRRILKSKPDIENTQTRFFLLSLLGALHAWWKHIPMIHTERGTRHTVLSNRIVDLISRFYDHVIGKWVVRRGQSVGVSDAACEFLKHIGAVTPITIPNGIVNTGCSQKIETLEPIILFVGRLIWAKGVQDLISAVKDIGRPYRLEIVGDGPYRSQLEKVAKGNCRIAFLGTVDNDKLGGIHSRATMFVNPSYSEGLPTCVMESTTFGTPTIATDVGGTREIIEHGVTGLLVKPHDVKDLTKSIQWVLDNRESAKGMATRAQLYTRTHYSWDKVVEDYIDLAKGICGN